jgi:tetratricopeptide (TPR) repeat protein
LTAPSAKFLFLSAPLPAPTNFARGGAVVDLFRQTTLTAVLLCGTIIAGPAAAEPEERAEQTRLSDHLRRHPTDYAATYRYVLISRDLGDHEAAIGALERLLAFDPSLARARKELGLLYARLGAYQTAALHLRAALEAPDLDPAQKAQIEAVLPDVERQTESSRWSARLQTGLRSQSNASFFPTDGLFMVGGVGVLSPAPRRADFNAFERVDIANDTDLDAARSAQLETRFKGYATQQFHLASYNVGVFGLSAGPRFALEENFLPGASVKPYVTGLTSYVGGGNFLNSGGAGVVARLPLAGAALTLEPGVEYRYLGVSIGGPFASLSAISTGSAVTASIGTIWRHSDALRLETRASFTRHNADLRSQSFDEIDAQALARIDFDPPFAALGLKWSIAPYGRIFQLAFDAVDPMVDPWRPRRDVGWAAGVLVEALVTREIGLSAAFEYARNESNLPNFRTDNLSVWFGPVARF